SFKDMAAKDPETWGDLNEQFHWDENEVAAAAKAQEEFEQRANGARCLEHLIHHVANQVYVFPDESESFDHEDARLLAKLTFVTQLDVTRIAEERELLFDDKSAALIAT